MENFVRCPHDRQNPYVMINRNLFRDKTISPECSWLIAHLLSHSDNFKIKVKQIIFHLKGRWGRDKVYNIINEAIEAGYIDRQEYLKDNPHRGFTKCYNYMVSEEPRFKKFLQRPDFQYTENTDTLEITTIKKEEKENIYTKEKEQKKEREIFSSGHVKMFKSEYETLVSLHGEKKIEDIIERMNDYAEIYPDKFKKYCSHAAVVRSWIRKDSQQPMNRKQIEELELKKKEEQKLLMQQQEEAMQKIKEKQRAIQQAEFNKKLEKNLPILKKYIQKYSAVLKIYGLVENGLYEITDKKGASYIYPFTEDNFEMRLHEKLRDIEVLE